MKTAYDAIVVGAGPNGLAAAIELARAGRSVLVREANERIGGAARTDALTLPGYRHDTFSAVHPLAVGSPYLSTLPLAEHGLEWVHSPAPLAHPFDDGTAAILERSVGATAAGLGATGAAYARLFGPLADGWPAIAEAVLGPLRVPREPVTLARFGLRAMMPAATVARRTLGGDPAGALFAGSAAHVGLPLTMPMTAAFGLLLMTAAHAVGWPFPRGGAGRITEAMASYLRSLGGEIETGAPVRSLAELPSARTVLLDLTPRQVLSVAGDALPSGYRRSLERFRYGPGIFKVDWALEAPIPWTAAACDRAGTVHLTGSLAEVVAAEEGPWRGEHAERPCVLLAQPSRFDPSRAPADRHVAWAYCQVPNGSAFDMAERIETQVERFAPGFRDLILARHVMDSRDAERLDENLVGGDLNGGAAIPRQLLVRPTIRANPYATPVEGLYICSASTPPGGGVHGMSGYRAARAVLMR